MTVGEPGRGWLVVALVVLLAASAGGHGIAVDGSVPAPSGVAVESPPPARSTEVAENGTSVATVNVTGRAIVERENGTTYLWPTEPFDVVASVDPGSPAARGSACLTLERNETALITQCRSFTGPGPIDLAQDRLSVRFGFDRWPTNTSGPHRLSVAFDKGGIAPVNTTLFAVRLGGDLDGDQLPNEKELSRGTNLTGTDSDRDGLLDGPEINEYGTDPLAADTDGDGLRDGTEIQRGTHPVRSDTDGDGVLDGDEVEVGTDPKSADTDADGLDDGEELVQASDPLARDTDGDGITDGRERVLGTDPLRTDTDGDTLGDALESRMGTDPASPWLPLVPLAIVPLALLVGLVVWLRRSDTRLIDRALAGVGRLRSDAAEDGTVVTTGRPSDGDGHRDKTLEGPPMTDEERMLELLDREGGRAKQVQIVEMTDWSKAKVSRVLSRMEENGEITRIKIGRENLVCLEGHLPKGVQSPFED